MALTRENVISALRKVMDPELHQDLVSLNMIKDVRVEGTHVTVHVELTTPACPLKERIRRDVEQAVMAVGAEKVTVEMSGRARGPAQAAHAAQPAENILPQVKNVIAVGAGKGGVGKSTVAVNLAIGLSRAGATVGLMDGDIYGPSIPTMLGIRGQVPDVAAGKMTPIQVHGIHAVTIGSLVDDDKPLIWRGPMAHHAFRQLFAENTTWPELDYLIVDLPPGTGDVPLTLCQLLLLTGAVIVATPQQVALDDCIRAVRMFETLNVAVLGVVENMSYFVGPDGSEHDIFGRGGAEQAAQQLSLPFLGAVPMFTELRVNSDAGNPQANFQGPAKLREALERITQNLAAQVSLKNLRPAAPELKIV